MLIKGRGGLSLQARTSLLVARAGTDEAQTIHVLAILQGAPFEADANTDSYSEAQASSAPALAGRLPGLARLTKRQQEVLSLLSAGFNTTAIAQKLKISPATAKTHVDDILRNLGVHSRVEAVLYGTLFHTPSSPQEKIPQAQ